MIRPGITKIGQRNAAVILAAVCLLLTGCPEEGHLGTTTYHVIMPCELAEMFESSGVVSSSEEEILSITCDMNIADPIDAAVDWGMGDMAPLGLVDLVGNDIGDLHVGPLCYGTIEIYAHKSVDRQQGRRGEIAFELTYKALTSKLSETPKPDLNCSGLEVTQ